MSENQAQSSFQPADELKNNSLDDVSVATTEVTEDLWESVPLPGTVDGPKEITSAEITSARENELLTLIHDLNDCNDALLSRVSQLEASLQKAQKIIENKANQNRLAQAQMAEHVSAQQAAAQLVSQNAQQQVAQLVARLENTEESLQRQQLINENLQAELNNSQERIAQLDHEAALNAQQYATEAQARTQAETSNRDLRSRLQRQQRYTLQFKAALEKSLTVSARSARQTTHGISDTVPSHLSSSAVSDRSAARATSFDTSNVNMPKARRIMPWASASAVSAFEGIDPHLENLIRGANQPVEEPVLYAEPPITQPPVPLPAQEKSAEEKSAEPISEGARDGAAVDSAAEAQLWQDLERVMDDPESPAVETVAVSDISAKEASSGNATSPVMDVVSVEATVEEDPDISASEDALESEPKLNWQSQAESKPTQAVAEAPSLSVAESTATPHSQIPPFAAEPLPPTNARAIPSNLNRLLTDSEVDFTEPSPWGNQPLPSLTHSAETVPTADAVPQRSDSRIPAGDVDDSSIAPVVDRLRTQKKATKMSSIQLPTFETAKAGSFKR